VIFKFASNNTGCTHAAENRTKVGAKADFLFNFLPKRATTQLAHEGFRVRFYSAPVLAGELVEAQESHSLIRLQKQLSKIDLLILDDLSYLSFSKRQSELLFQVISDRSELASLIISTNLEFSKWVDFFGDPMLTAALVDRVTHRAHILNMNGDSYRLRESKARNTVVAQN
jgi:DNA replication protein DnaC